MHARKNAKSGIMLLDFGPVCQWFSKSIWNGIRPRFTNEKSG